MKKSIEITCNIIKLSFVFGMVVFISLGCNLSDSQENLVRQELKLDIELKDFQGNRGHFVNSVRLYYVGNYTVVGVPSKNEHSDVTINKKGEILKDTLTKTDTTYTYHISENLGKNKVGLKYNGFDDIKGAEYNVDSLFTKYTFPKFPFFRKGKLTLVSKKVLKSSAIELYRPIVKIDSTYADSIYYHFDHNLLKGGYSFSPYLDSLKKSKVSKVIFVYNPTKGNIQSGRKFSFELTEHPAGESSKIIALISRYKSEIKQIH